MQSLIELSYHTPFDQKYLFNTGSSVDLEIFQRNLRDFFRVGRGAKYYPFSVTLQFSFFGAGREGDWPPPALLARFAHVDLVIWFLTLFRSATCTYMYVVYEKASTDVLQRDDEKINFRRTFVNINCKVRTPRTQHVDKLKKRV